MGRKKQIRPRHAGGIVQLLGELDSEKASQNQSAPSSENEDAGTPFYVEVDRTSWVTEEPLYISELVLKDLNVREGFYDFWLNEDLYKHSASSLRFCLHGVINHGARTRLGQSPILSAACIRLEFITKCDSEDTVILSGSFDGPSDGISGLVHLVSLGFLTLRPVLGVDISSLRVRVQILRNAFTASKSLLDNTRQVWRKSMMPTMAWLRPEVMTSEAKYGITDTHIHREQPRFDVAGFYEAIKPSKEDPMLEDNISDLLPVLRPYQRRAVYWMVQQEKGNSGSFGSEFMTPLCMPINLLNGSSRMFYNPFSGSVSLNPECSSPHVCGGILADEMGLGKTVELLACIFAHRRPTSEIISLDDALPSTENLRRFKKERVECVCGAVTESPKYKGLWVQCDICDAWQHAECVQYLPRKLKRNRNTDNMVVMEGDHVCRLCSELIEATRSPIATGATLIICPSPILQQWQSEIARHSKPGSLAICIYEGVASSQSSSTSKINFSELVRADIVLTTYDVLRGDLSHDSDRHEGDRRLMRFKKRYPVTPTPLTRISWWRICLDEAQMVESGAAAATEMAIRLHSAHRWCVTGTPIQRRLDDFYGLLKFLEASPFDVYKWWNEVIQDPYEKGDSVAREFTHRFFRRIIYRSQKVHVADELLLPPQEERLTWLTFSPIEEYFYQRQHEACVCDAREVIECLNDDILKRVSDPSESFITQAEASKLLNSLLKLRQACCHPQVGTHGLCSLHQSPMTMETILQVLVHKTKLEGEEALRRLIVALNGLAGIAIIDHDFSEAVSLYKEAMAFTAEHSEDFSLDPLLNIHIHFNLAEVLSGFFQHGRPYRNGLAVMESKKQHAENCEECLIKHQKLLTVEDDASSISNENGLIDDSGCYSRHCPSFCVSCLRAACETMKKRFLSTFTAKLTAAQQEFRKSYMQVSHAFDEKDDYHDVWWLEALDYAGQSQDSANELIRKILDAVSIATDRISSRFRSINAIKYHIQTGLDLLEASRKTLVDKLLEIDQKMECPREEDISRVRNCPGCHGSGDARICVHCELDESFQVYEARLFRANEDFGGEEIVDLQRRKSELNRFWGTLPGPNKQVNSSENEENKRKRDGVKGIVISRSASVLEIVLGVLKSHVKNQSRYGFSAAAKHLHLLESMRKEYAHARSLATAQAQVFRAHDEINMSTSRLHLREDEDDKSVDAVSSEELVAAKIDNSNEKFSSLALLSRIKGQLRYLEGIATSSDENKDSMVAGEEACPICQEKLKNQKMVFQCGHVTCCKCLFAMTEQRLVHQGSGQPKWLMCPTCRQATKFENIAYADDGENKSSTLKGHEISEALVTVQGSYSTKIEAITRRILWIRSCDSRAKVLVFSSWNDVLDVLEHALTANYVSHVRMKGGRKSHTAISQFRGQKTSAEATYRTHEDHHETEFVQVLLLLIQHGANGLNLLEAQHVVLAEPLLNPAAEAQAISRVHRIGQENRTVVHRFMVKKTVEESIYKLNRSRSSGSFVSGNKKNQDQPLLTRKDVEFLFEAAPPGAPENVHDEEPSGSLRHLPPSVAAAMAAERRMKEF